MTHHKKSSKCSCEKKTKKEHKQLQKEHSHYKNCGCNCETKFYFPLPNLPTQPVGGLRVEPGAWFAPGSVQACCSICSTVKPVYANPCDTCRYDKGVYPINNTAYFTTGQYLA
jgi:hypothetical protein